MSLYLALLRILIRSAVLGLIAANLIEDFWIYFGDSVDFDTSPAALVLKPRVALVDSLADYLRCITYRDLLRICSVSIVAWSFW